MINCAKRFNKFAAFLIIVIENFQMFGNKTNRTKNKMTITLILMEDPDLVEHIRTKPRFTGFSGALPGLSKMGNSGF